MNSGSNVSLVSWTFLQSLRFSGALEDYKGKILTANKTSLLVEGRAKLMKELEKIAPKFRAVFILSTLDTFHCLLGLGFLTKNDCI